jgi:hypothetical protein
MTNHKEDTRLKATQDIEELVSIEKESQAQKLPEQMHIECPHILVRCLL